MTLSADDGVTIVEVVVIVVGLVITWAVYREARTNSASIHDSTRRVDASGRDEPPEVSGPEA